MEHENSVSSAKNERYLDWVSRSLFGSRRPDSADFKRYPYDVTSDRIDISPDLQGSIKITMRHLQSAVSDQGPSRLKLIPCVNFGP
jgi:hypothetical protein